ncbi:hypothetical protein KKH14_02660 [Patescibacteria group bacterium]|nr:hypothetical protein [Patescibacteria group bacterium]
MNNHKNNLIKDASIVALSVLIAIILLKTGVFINILASSKSLELLGSFIAGIFFTSVFTAAPAAVVLAEIARVNSVILVALFGGAGAMIGDMIIFRFVKDKLSGDILYLLKKSKSEKLISIFKLRIFRWSLAFLGALVIASPLPDELGLMMLGFSKMKTSLFVPVSFLFNSLGILIIGLIARAVM